MKRTAWVHRTNLFLLLGLTFALGCGPAGLKGRAVVQGSVSIGGKKLNAGTVTMATKDGKAGTGSIDSSGNYKVTDAPLGEVTIMVSVPRMGLGPAVKAPTTAGADKMGSFKQIDPSKVVQVPQKYSKFDSSPLKYTVKSGEQTYDIELTP